LKGKRITSANVINKGSESCWLAEAGDKEGALAAYRQALEWKPGDEGITAKVKALEK